MKPRIKPIFKHSIVMHGHIFQAPPVHGRMCVVVAWDSGAIYTVPYLGHGIVHGELCRCELKKESRREITFDDYRPVVDGHGLRGGGHGPHQRTTSRDEIPTERG